MKKLMVVALTLMVMLCFGAISFAGSLDDTGSPTTAGGGAMNTLEDIYNILDAGNTTEPRTTTFTEPTAGPAATGHTLTEVYDRAKTSSRPAKTGQTICYDTSGTVISCSGTGQDGNWRKGVEWPSPRFEDNGDGTVTDNLTGLIWLEHANCYDLYDGGGDGIREWGSALTVCNNVGDGATYDCGLSDGSSAGDWRLPNVKELYSLLDLAYYNPALSNDAGTGQWSSACVESGDCSFTNVQTDYWSSTAGYEGGWIRALYVRMNCGEVLRGARSGQNKYVWCVRGGQ
jgi:hypothetical protein